MRSFSSGGITPRNNLDVTDSRTQWIRWAMHEQPVSGDDSIVRDSRGTFPDITLDGTTSSVWSSTAGWFSGHADGNAVMVSDNAVINSFFNTSTLDVGGAYIFWFNASKPTGATSAFYGLMAFGNTDTGATHPGFRIIINASDKWGLQCFNPSQITTLSPTALSADDSEHSIFIYLQKTSATEFQASIYTDGAGLDQDSFTWELYPHPDRTSTTHGFIWGSSMLAGGTIQATAELDGADILVSDVNIVRTNVDVSSRIATFARSLTGAKRSIPYWIRSL